MRAIITIFVISLLYIFSGSAIASDGSKIYKEKCSMCHGPIGAGTPMGPSLKENEFVTKGKADDIKKVIIEGRTRPDKKFPKISIDMPGIPMSDEDARILLLFIQGDLQK